MQPAHGRLGWQWFQMWMLISILHYLNAAPKPQNGMELVGVGVMTAASSALDIMQKGMAVRKDLGFDSPFGGANSKTELGFGEAIVRRPNSEEDSDEDRRRRRKRAAAGGSVDILPHTKHPHLHRGKRSPCYTGGGQPTTGGGQTQDAEEIARRRAQRKRNAAARKRSQNSTTTARKTRNTKRSTNANKFHSRLRRQAGEQDMAEEAKTLGQKISEHAKQAAEKFRSFWTKMMSTVKEVAQNVKASFSGNATGEGPPNGVGSN